MAALAQREQQRIQDSQPPLAQWIVELGFVPGPLALCIFIAPTLLPLEHLNEPFVPAVHRTRTLCQSPAIPERGVRRSLLEPARMQMAQWMREGRQSSEHWRSERRQLLGPIRRGAAVALWVAPAPSFRHELCSNILAAATLLRIASAASSARRRTVRASTPSRASAQTKRRNQIVRQDKDVVLQHTGSLLFAQRGCFRHVIAAWR